MILHAARLKPRQQPECFIMAGLKCRAFQLLLAHAFHRLPPPPSDPRREEGGGFQNHVEGAREGIGGLVFPRGTILRANIAHARLFASFDGAAGEGCEISSPCSRMTGEWGGERAGGAGENGFRGRWNSRGHLAATPARTGDVNRRHSGGGAVWRGEAVMSALRLRCWEVLGFEWRLHAGSGM